jgi:mannose-6-phosphate isomerase-like protein (cupin superfamily)
VRRDPALVPLSHDHHHALVRARRLRRAAAGDGDLAREAAAFVRGFARESVPHFRDEEERLFPAALEHAPETAELIAELLVEHVRLHALVARLARQDLGASGAAAELLAAHVRREERELFPALPESALAGLRLDERSPQPVPPVVDLAGAPGDRGPLWGTATEDLNATLLEWPPGSGQPERANEHRDLLFVVVAGGGTATVGGTAYELAAGRAVLVPKGTPFSVEAGAAGLRYLSVHLRRPGLEIGRF